MMRRIMDAGHLSVRRTNEFWLNIDDAVDRLTDDAAWAAVDEKHLLQDSSGSGWRNDGALRRWLLEKTPTTHPTRVGHLVVAEAGSLAAQANAKKYRAVTQLLRRAKELFLGAGDVRGWGIEYERFLATHWNGSRRLGCNRLASAAECLKRLVGTLWYRRICAFVDSPGNQVADLIPNNPSA